MTKIANKTVKRLYDDKGRPKKDAPTRTPPPLSLTPETFTKDELESRKKGSYMLKVNAAQEGSADYKFTMYHVDGTDSLRTVIQWTKDIWQVINGLGLTNDPEGMIPLIEATCHASALSAFQDTMSTTRKRLRRERERKEWGTWSQSMVKPQMSSAKDRKKKHAPQRLNFPLTALMWKRLFVP
jgi:organic hydroperoxide reductase OsmC/OhrA